MRRWVVFLSLNNFYVTAEKNLHPELEEKAIVVVRGGEILDISPEAKREGVLSDVSLSHLRSIPRIFILPYNEEDYFPLYHRIWNLVIGLFEKSCGQGSSNYAMKVEPVDFHAGFIQLAQNIVPREWVLELKEELVRSTGLKSRVGGGPNKLIARLSARWEMLIPEGEVGHFLLSVPIRSLDWVDSRVTERLNRLGVSTVGEIKAVPETLLKKEFPKYADLLSRIGKGVDLNPVIRTYPPEKEEKVVELEGESDYRVLIEYLSFCSKELSKNLRSRGKEGLELGFMFLEGKEEKRSKKKLINPISSHKEILRIASELLREMWRGGEIYTIRITLSQLKTRLEGFRRISRTYGPADVWTYGNVDQLDILRARRKTGLESSVERIKKKYGSSIIGFKKRRRRMAELILEKRGRYLL